MKLVSYAINTEIGRLTRIGALVEDGVIDLNAAYAAYLKESGMAGREAEAAAGLVPPDMIGFIEGGRPALDAAAAVIEYVSDRLQKKLAVSGVRGERLLWQPDEIELLAPLPRPLSIRDTQSFEGHIKGVMERIGKQVPELWYRSPCYYKGNPGSVVGTGATIIWPKYTEKLDYELELGIYIGKKGKNISIEEAPSYIAGYTVFNDITARDTVNGEMSLLGPAKGKDFDNSNIMGPCLVTPDEIDPSNLRMTARVNGETWSEGNSSGMYWSFAQIIAHISTAETIYPGDFIGSGTVKSGCGMELDRWLQPGDVIELEIEGIGVISNRIVREEEFRE